MRIAPVLIVTCALVASGLLSACGTPQSSIQRAFMDDRDHSRAAQADLDVQAILQGIEQARSSDQWVARALEQPSPAPSPVTR